MCLQARFVDKLFTACGDILDARDGRSRHGMEGRRRARGPRGCRAGLAEYSSLKRTLRVMPPEMSHVHPFKAISGEMPQLEVDPTAHASLVALYFDSMGSQLRNVILNLKRCSRHQVGSNYHARKTLSELHGHQMMTSVAPVESVRTDVLSQYHFYFYSSNR